MINLIITTALAGVAGTGLGGVIGALFRKDSNRTVSLLLSFAGGVMISVVCFDLIRTPSTRGWACTRFWVESRWEGPSSTC